MNQKTFLSQIKDFIKRPKFFLIATTLLVAIVLGAFFLIKYSIPVPNIFKAEYIEDDNFKLKEVLRLPGIIEKVTVKANPVTGNDTVALLRLEVQNARVLNFFPTEGMIVMPACEGGKAFTDTEVCIDIASKNPLQRGQVLGEIQLQWGFSDQSILKGLETNAYYNLNEDKLSNYEIEPLEVSLFGGLSFTGDDDLTKNTLKSSGKTVVSPKITKSSTKLTPKTTTSTSGTTGSISKSSRTDSGSNTFGAGGNDSTYQTDMQAHSNTSGGDPKTTTSTSGTTGSISKSSRTDSGSNTFGTGGNDSTYQTDMQAHSDTSGGDPSDSSKLACGDTGCNNDDDCATGLPDYSCKTTDDVSKCILNCKEGETRIDDCMCTSESTINRKGACGVIDIDSNGKLDYVDLADFAKSYNMICTDSSIDITNKDLYSCGRKDTNGDGRVDYKDLSNFATRYHTIKNTCSL